MCYAIPGKVKLIKDKIAIVDYFGEEKKTLNEIKDLRVGDYVYAQGGYILQKIEESLALKILDDWKDLFFELKEIDASLLKKTDVVNPKLQKILDKALNLEGLLLEEQLYLLSLSNKTNLSAFYNTANNLRKKFHDNSCCVHGIIEISNHCSQNCHYCGISNVNKDLFRYKMSLDEIYATVKECVEVYGFKSIVLQSGQNCGYDYKELAVFVKRIIDDFKIFICISFGEIGVENLKLFFDAGARGLLMRFETSNQNIYKKIKSLSNFADRIKHLKEAYRMGYLIFTGSLIGLPGQTDEDIINDINLAHELKAEMFSFGPFLPHPGTLLSKEPVIDSDKMFKVLSLARIMCAQDSKILVTTAFETLNKEARRNGLMSGGSSVMLNLTPLKYRKFYNIYPNRAHDCESIKMQVDDVVKLLQDLGRAPTDLSISQGLSES